MGQGANAPKVRDGTRNESRIVVEGIQGSLSISRQSLARGWGVWKCRALGPDAALSKRPEARSISPSLSYPNLFCVILPFPFLYIFPLFNPSLYIAFPKYVTHKYVSLLY